MKLTRSAKIEIYRQWKLLNPRDAKEEASFMHGWDITAEQLSKIIENGDEASSR